MKKYENGLVSLVTPGWNGRSFVHRLMDSIIAQTYRPIQYIYVDDGSTDGTAQIVESYSEKFRQANIDFKFIRQENAGVCGALMTGWQYVEGEYLSNPEYDDILFSNSVAKRVEYLVTHPDCAVVVADAWSVPEDNIEERKRLATNMNPNRFDRNHFCQSLMSNTLFNAACYMVRMDRFDATHPGRKILPYKYGPNQQILLPLYYYWNRGFIEEPLSLYLNRCESLGKTELVSFEEHIQRLCLYKDVINQTLEGIEMTPNDLQIYKKRVELGIQNEALDLAYRYKKYEPFIESYNYLLDSGELSKSQVLMRQELEHPYLYSVYYTIVRVINKLFSIFGL